MCINIYMYKYIYIHILYEYIHIHTYVYTYVIINILSLPLLYRPMLPWGAPQAPFFFFSLLFLGPRPAAVRYYDLILVYNV